MLSPGQSPLTSPPDEVVDLAFEAKARSSSPTEAARGIAAAVYDAVAYVAGVTGVRTTARATVLRASRIATAR